MNKLFEVVGIIALVFGFLAGQAQAENVQAVLVDANATAETRTLFDYLRQSAKSNILFGHQHATCYGVGWKNDDRRSDVKDVTGSFPAVYGWDMGDAGSDHQAKLIIEAFERGGVNTISWHMKNPVTGGAYNDLSVKAVKDVLPGGRAHEVLRKELDSFAGFLKSLKDGKGRLVPVIFRPWHEHTGDWFWWGSRTCTPEEFIALWRFTVTYLRDVKGVHNLLWAYSPAMTGVGSRDDYEKKRFPGYEYMDILGADVYTKEDISVAIKMCHIAVELAEQKGKVPALTEFGYIDGLSNCKRNDWYTKCFLEPLKADPVARRIAYVLTWRNATKDHFWVPYPGHPAVEDFKKFYADPLTLFENDLPKDLYGKLRFAGHREGQRSPQGSK